MFKSRELFTLAMAVGSFMMNGCVATIQENHYFAAYKDTEAKKEPEPVQFYRLSVNGQSWFSNTRYLTGYYDERAISLFFNEIKSPPNQRLFDDNTTLPGAAPGTKLAALSPTPENGAFVLIMSTNADAIASSIGSFAESQVMADALTRLVNKDRFKVKSQSDAKVAVQKAQGQALFIRLTSQTSAARTATKGLDAVVSYRRALTALAQGLGYNGPEFESIDKAREWFALEASRPGVKQ